MSHSGTHVDESFENKTVFLDRIPEIPRQEFQRLNHRYLHHQLTTITIFWLVLCVIASSVQYFQLLEFTELTVNESVRPWLWRGLFILIIISTVWQPVQVKNCNYLLRDHDVVYRKGVFWKKEIAVPFNRVQHIETERSLFERWFSLSELKLFTAGGHSADLVIPGLSLSDAERIKEYILSRTGDLHD